MKRIAFVLALIASVAIGAPQTAQAQMPGQARPCTFVMPADLAAAHLAPVETTGLGPMFCYLVWSRPAGKGISVGARPLPVLGQPDVGPGMCAKMLSTPEKNVQRQKTRSCKEVPGYGKFAVLITTDSDRGRYMTALIFDTMRYRVSIMSVGVPGGDAAAAQSLGKVLAAKYR